MFPFLAVIRHWTKEEPSVQVPMLNISNEKRIVGFLFPQEIVGFWFSPRNCLIFLSLRLRNSQSNEGAVGTDGSKLYTGAYIYKGITCCCDSRPPKLREISQKEDRPLQRECTPGLYNAQKIGLMHTFACTHTHTHTHTGGWEWFPWKFAPRLLWYRGASKKTEGVIWRHSFVTKTSKIMRKVLTERMKALIDVMTHEENIDWYHEENIDWCNENIYWCNENIDVMR